MENKLKIMGHICQHRSRLPCIDVPWLSLMVEKPTKFCLVHLSYLGIKKNLIFVS